MLASSCLRVPGADMMATFLSAKVAGCLLLPAFSSPSYQQSAAEAAARRQVRSMTALCVYSPKRGKGRKNSLVLLPDVVFLVRHV